MGQEEVVVGGLKLPAALVAAIADGTWRPPNDSSTYRAVFGEDEPDFPQFFGLTEIERENGVWQRRRPEEVFGVPGGESVGVEPASSVLIGTLGADMAIALDYRESRDSPRVLYLGYQHRPNWRVIADDVPDLLRRLSGS